ncbi:MAG: hypothetical protein AABY22_10665, partial [Nanoarchaeota archaeon]
MEFKPIYYKDRLNIINPQGIAGIVTLWTPVEDITIEENGKRISLRGFLPEVREKFPQLLKENSPIAVITSLFG